MKKKPHTRNNRRLCITLDPETIGRIETVMKDRGFLTISEAIRWITQHATVKETDHGPISG